jgi:hypothetical protein
VHRNDLLGWSERRTSAAKAGIDLRPSRHDSSRALPKSRSYYGFPQAIESHPSRVACCYSELHVKQTEPRQTVLFQQALVDVLLLQLIDLCSGHFPAIGSEIAVGFGADRDELFIGS